MKAITSLKSDLGKVLGRILPVTSDTKILNPETAVEAGGV
jgi:hypothetical protein